MKASGLCRIVRALFQKLCDQLKYQLLLFRRRGAFGIAPSAFVLLAQRTGKLGHQIDLLVGQTVNRNDRGFLATGKIIDLNTEAIRHAGGGLQIGIGAPVLVFGDGCFAQLLACIGDFFRQRRLRVPFFYAQTFEPACKIDHHLCQPPTAYSVSVEIGQIFRYYDL